MSTEPGNVITDDQRNVLIAFSKALQREAHVLQDHPDLLWQQLYNRAKSEDMGEYLSRTLDEGVENHSNPWLKLNHPYRESNALIRTITGHDGEVSDCAFSPDGKVLATIADKTIRLWDILTGEEKFTLEGHTSDIYCCNCSPMDHLLVTAGGDSDLRLWDIRQGKLKTVFSGHEDGVNCCAFSSDGKRIASGSPRTIRLWDVESGLEIKKWEFSGISDQIISIVFSQDGRWMATINAAEKRLRVRFAKNGRQKAVLSSGISYYTHCDFLPGRDILAAGNEAGQVELWDISSKSIMMTLTCHETPVSACTFSPDGKTLITGGEDGEIKLWEVETGKLLRIYYGHTGLVSSCVFSPDGKKLVSSSYDKTIKVWHAEIEKETISISGHFDEIGDFAFSPKDHSVLSMSADNTFRLWNYETGNELSVFPDWIDASKGIDFSFNGQFLACVGSDRIIKLYDMSSRKLLFQIPSTNGYILELSPDGKLFAVVHYDFSISIWDIKTQSQVSTLTGHANVIYSCHFSPDGKLIATCSYDGSIRIWNVKTFEIFTIIKSNSSIDDFCFSPDNKLLAFINNKEIYLWDLNNQQQIRHYEILKDSVIDLSFTTDGQLIIFAGRKWIQILDVQTGLIKRVLQRPNWVSWAGRDFFTDEVVKTCALSPDGRLLAYARDETLIEIWNLRNDRLVGRAVTNGRITACRFSPDGSVVAIGDNGGNVYFMELIGFNSIAGRQV